MKKQYLKSSSLTTLLAITSGISVANVYYAQPMSLALSEDFSVGLAYAALLPGLVQFGNFVGILLLAPIGDAYDRRQSILATTAFLVCSLVIAAMSPNLPFLMIVGFMVGIFSSVVQQIVPFALHITSEQNRGRILGIITGCILLGIILSRAVSGAIIELWNWRHVFLFSAAIMATILFLLYIKLPHTQNSTRVGYFELISSLTGVLPKFPALVIYVLTQSLIFAGFMGFWTALPLYLSSTPFHYSAGEISLFALLGGIGVVAAPACGWLIDKHGVHRIARVSVFLVLMSFILITLFPLSLSALIIAILIMDLGAQSCQISQQIAATNLDDKYRNRINTIFMATMILGGAIGSTLSGLAFSYTGWTGSIVTSLTLSAIAILVQTIYRKKLI